MTEFFFFSNKRVNDRVVLYLSGILYSIKTYLFCKNNKAMRVNLKHAIEGVDTVHKF